MSIGKNMVSKVFDEILAKGIRSGQIPARTQQSRDWFRTTARKTSVTAETLIRSERTRYKNRVSMGKMYLFNYDPKHKATLPYYDRYPLIFPVQPADGGFYGINMHYLPHVLRARLMDALYSLSNNRRYDEKTKLKLSYNILNSVTKYKAFKPTFKRYLTNHVRSRFIEISSAEWDIALMMPLQKFAKASASEVWRDSRKIAK
jgi:hypothetical protein|tara:strand:- start:1041 stop:1649 length:609 start_codon:yes stop_codon:yes gene_type:complete